ncbi:hypothetical protein KRR26_34965 [Corallococcus sp. M34]|uniref:SMODS domain-containing nucleotidyltransferase n=1 Tax=Citreicoccus inhibens TaxID=2849499 RepID=UPI001C22AFCC|nr:nucleotidyltransferase [Citreicoccus inhibens]MBU8900819.1 hypothetical protein [Citreicoccus inhibens]
MNDALNGGGMFRSVADGFAKLLEAIEPNPKEVDARASHRRSIEQALDTSFANFNRLAVIGSHTRETAIRGYSDVDYLAVLGKADVMHGGKVVQSSTVLANVRRALGSRFKSTEIRNDGPSVVVNFKGGEGAVDVVPGYWSGTTGQDGYPVFAIPDGVGGWLLTSPQRHSKYLVEEGAASRYKLKGTIRLLKAWKYARTPSVPLLSFHLELLLASAGTCKGIKTYGACLLDAFRLLRDRGGSALNDPLGISGRIPIVYTAHQAEALVKHAAHAAFHADAALSAEQSGLIDEAFRQWRIVFNGWFPSRR